MQQCKITFGRFLKNARQEREFSQRDLCTIISKYHPLDPYQLSKIENDRIEIPSIDYGWLIPIIADLFDADIEWLEQIRSQTEPQPLDLRKAIFPVYFKLL
jgi:transcriptional regulator with XRE-family HTH domain